MELMNAAQLATKLNVSLAFIRKKTMEGMPVHHIGRCARYNLEEEVLPWFDQQAKKKPNSEHLSPQSEG